jgi:hypothetical protein
MNIQEYSVALATSFESNKKYLNVAAKIFCRHNGPLLTQYKCCDK